MRKNYFYLLIVSAFSIIYGVIDFYLDTSSKYRPIVAPALILGFLYPGRFLFSVSLLVVTQFWVNIGLNYCTEIHPHSFDRVADRNLIYSYLTIFPGLLAGAAGVIINHLYYYLFRRLKGEKSSR
jgi:hypothetical protein